MKTATAARTTSLRFRAIIERAAPHASCELAGVVARRGMLFPPTKDARALGRRHSQRETGPHIFTLTITAKVSPQILRADLQYSRYVSTDMYAHSYSSAVSLAAHVTFTTQERISASIQ